jgi:hypothetical protein
LTVGLAAVAVLATRGGSSGAPEITPTSIAGARLGLARAAYERLFGERGVLVYQEQGGGTGWATLTFADKKVWVFFPDGLTGKATIITTWNAAYKTRAGVGPCSTIADLKKTYGTALWTSQSQEGFHFEYNVGKNLIFSAAGLARHPSKFVTAAGLFDGSARDASGTRPFAEFVTGNETPSCRPS